VSLGFGNAQHSAQDAVGVEGGHGQGTFHTCGAGGGTGLSRLVGLQVAQRHGREAFGGKSGDSFPDRDFPDQSDDWFGNAKGSREGEHGSVGAVVRAGLTVKVSDDGFQGLG
jgi:hypothetical protein